LLTKIGEWLEAELLKTHKKWDAIDHEMNMRKHQAAMKKAGQVGGETPAAAAAASSSNSSRAAERVFGASGALMKITRDEYRRGLKKLNANTFKSPTEQKEWEDFRDSLSPTTLAIVSAKKWE
jgi:hypothetical protein